MTPEAIIGTARAMLDDAHHWLRVALESRSASHRDEARKRLIAARNRIDEVLAMIGGAE